VPKLFRVGYDLPIRRKIQFLGDQRLVDSSVAQSAVTIVRREEGAHQP
jgi:hypothetical protein